MDVTISDASIKTPKYPSKEWVVYKAAAEIVLGNDKVAATENPGEDAFEHIISGGAEQGEFHTADVIDSWDHLIISPMAEIALENDKALETEVSDQGRTTPKYPSINWVINREKAETDSNAPEQEPGTLEGLDSCDHLIISPMAEIALENDKVAATEIPGEDAKANFANLEDAFEGLDSSPELETAIDYPKALETEVSDQGRNTPKYPSINWVINREKAE